MKFAAALMTAFAILLSTLALLSTPAAAKESDILLTNATILDGAGGRMTGDILLRDGKVAQLGKGLANADAKRIDATSRWITPGIIDAHTHYGTFLLPLAGDDTSDVSERLAPNVAGTRIEDGVRPADPAFAFALSKGVTTLQILPGSNSLFAGRSVTVNPVPGVVMDDIRVKSAPRGLKMACGANPAYRSITDNRFPSSRQGEIAMVRADFQEAQKIMRSGKEANANQQSLIAAIKGEAPVHLHCYRAEDISNWLNLYAEFGIKHITVHHASEAYKIAPRLARDGVCVATWLKWWGFKREAEDAIAENAAIIDAAGGCVMMHSDIPVVGGLLNLEAAAAAAAGRRAGLDIPPERAIKWITLNPARSMGIADRTGTLAPGKDADVVLWSGDPFSVYSQPDLVILRGSIVYDRSRAKRPSDFELGRPALKPVK